MDYYEPLYEHKFYHIYNRGNNGENIFYKHDNYIYFLRKYDQYLSDFLETFAYCLLPNHFHLLVRIKSFSHFPTNSAKNFPGFQNLESLACLPKEKHVSNELRCSEQFRKLFMAYAKAINKQEKRTGSLFQKNFKRKEVTNDAYLNQVIYYIHANATLHGIHHDFKNYPYNSHGRILAEKPSKLQKRELLELLGGKDSYIAYHDSIHDQNRIAHLVLED